MIKHFILIAYRNIKRRRTLSFIQIMCLSIGLAAFMLIARYVQYEKNYDKFNENFDRLYRTQTYKIGDRTDDARETVVPIAKYLCDNVPEVESAILTNELWNEYLSSDAEHTYNEQKGYVAPSEIFELFSFELIRGDKNNALDQPNSIVLSQTMAEKYFPGQDALGKIILDGQKKELLITGIMKDIPEQSTIDATYFRSNSKLLKNMSENWTNSSFECYVLLKPNVSHKAVSKKIKDFVNDHDIDAKRVLYLHPLSELHLNQDAGDDSGSVIYYFSFIGILTLLLACVSFMNITTAFSTLRSLEIGIRKVSGSNKNIIRLQFLSEAIVIACISFILAIFIAHLVLPIFNTVINRNIELKLFQFPLFMAFLLLVVLITGFIGGSYPALVISGFKPVSVLKGNNPFKKGKVTGLNVMVYIQFLLSVILITSSLWMYKQVSYLKNKDLGFQKEHLLHCKLPNIKTNISFNQVRQRILQNPGIEDMSISINSPLHSNWGTRLQYEGGPTDDHAYARWNKACANYLNTMSMKLVRGRNFSEVFSAEQKNCLVNETAVKQFGWENPIGKWIDNGNKYRVIGVIQDFNIQDIHNPIIPYVLFYRDEGFGVYNDLTFKVNPTTTENSLAHINAVLTASFPHVLFEVKGYNDGADRVALKIWTSATNTFTFFTVMAVLIAAMGLFGLVIFASQRKVKEIGIRKVQGARTNQILPLITKQFFYLVLAANVFVIPVAKLIENVTPGHFKYHFTVIDFFIVLGISVFVTILSSGFQAFKASRLNPVDTLRYE